MNLFFKMLAFETFSVLCLTSLASGYESWNATNVCCDGTIGDFELDCCGNQTYNSSEKVCCNKKLYPAPDGADADDYDCCGSDATDPVIYNIRNSVCCGGILSNSLAGIDASKYFQCCDDPGTNSSQPFIRSISLCCDGVILEKEDPERNYMCCGTQMIEYPGMRNRDCNGERRLIGDVGEYLSCCGDAYVYDSNEKACAYFYDEESQEETYKLLNLTDNHSSTCGLELYDTLTQECCGYTVYQTATRICCGDKVSPNESELMACCYEDDSVYDITTHYCDRKGVTALKQTTIDTFKKSIAACGPSFPVNISINPYKVNDDNSLTEYISSNDSHICCNGKIGTISMMCCGDETYDPDESVCCGSQVFDIPEDESSSSEFYSCCGSKAENNLMIYDSSSYLCCGGELLDDIDVNEYGCCSNSRTGYSDVYEYDTQACCNGGILDLKDSYEEYECCGNELIFRTTYDDVDDSESEQKYENENENADAQSELCCGDQFKYDSQSQMCAQRYDEETGDLEYKVLDNKNGTSASCGFELYNPEIQSCCNYKVYNTETELCCGDQVHSSTPLVDCCYADYKIYDVSIQTCDVDGVVDLTPDVAAQRKADLKKCGPTFPPMFPDNNVYYYIEDDIKTEFEF